MAYALMIVDEGIVFAGPSGTIGYDHAKLPSPGGLAVAPSMRRRWSL